MSSDIFLANKRIFTKHFLLNESVINDDLADKEDHIAPEVAVNIHLIMMDNEDLTTNTDSSVSTNFLIEHYEC